jgi:fimbrial chaperone protein
MKASFLRYGVLGLGVIFASAMGRANAAATILLWPIDPWLSADTKATELWIQNQGNSATTMQVRIVRWRQENGFERYTAQQDVVASPPIVNISKGSKQLIRLIKQSDVPMGVVQPIALLSMKSLNPATHPSLKWASNSRCAIPFRFLFMVRVSRPSKKGRIMRWWKPIT